MGIQYFEEEHIFKLDTKNSSYLIGIADERYIGHIYYGSKLSDHRLSYLMRTEEAPFVPSKNLRDKISFFDTFPMEYPTGGIGDFRESAIEICSDGGYTALEFVYETYEIIPGKVKLNGLPATFGDGADCTTLKLYAMDPVIGLEVILNYNVFEDTDCITRSVCIVNQSKLPITLTKVISASFDMNQEDYELITLHGSWGRERHIQTRKIGYGTSSIGSFRGESSHQEHPFIALKESSADQNHGAVYGMHFVYSGNFLAEVSVNQFQSVRMMMGIHPKNFSWKLEEGEQFQTPEVVLVYSNSGLGGMSRSLHDLYKNHLIRGEYKDKERPILINNWEATYFQFDTGKLLSIAREASKLGIEMLVMDDGWFGNRYDDNRALGDWIVNEEKLPGGLEFLVQEVNKLGLKFGIWFEPEMVSPDSELYRRHPDWAIHVPGREASLSRNQYVLDITRPEVRNYVYESVANVLRSANIEYVKWDMNRPLTDVGSCALSKERQGEFYHRYVLAVYELQERLLTEFPYLLLENCSSGGARFDPGMLYYSPQIWCSDDTDAIERLAIQEGTALLYPLSTIGAHVSDCPNHITGRVTPFETRGYVALAGTFGYELDITKISEEERREIPKQIKMYHQYNRLIRSGDYYRIASYQENQEYDCYAVVAKDKSEALVTYIQVLIHPNQKSRLLKLKGLDEKKRYSLLGTDEIYAGDTLMNAGILMHPIRGDYQGKLLHFVETYEG